MKKSNDSHDLLSKKILSATDLRQRLKHAPALPLDKLLAITTDITPFQKQVWQVLMAIPSGYVTHYQVIADVLGNPSASRAVGRAIGSNPLAITIPCHRVICKDGRPGGYRWGVEKKIALLKQESNATAS